MVNKIKQLDDLIELIVSCCCFYHPRRSLRNISFVCVILYIHSCMDGHITSTWCPKRRHLVK